MLDRQAELTIIRQRIKQLDQKYCSLVDLTLNERSLWQTLRNITKDIKIKRFWIALAKKNGEPFDDIQALINESIDEGMELINGRP